MDPRQIEALVARLVANPHDQEALGYAHQAGAADPMVYATVLERVGGSTTDPAFAAHWLSEAANVYSVSLGDAHRAAQLLMAAIDRDPSAEAPAERLGALYRERGEHKSLAALTERRAKALLPYAQQSPETRAAVGAMYEELGRMWNEPPLSQPRKAAEHFRRALELEPRSVFSIYGLREIHKAAEQWADAIPYFDLEHALIDDPARKVALYQDESTVRQQAGDKVGATQVLRNARVFAPEDPVLLQGIGALVVERIKSGEAVAVDERDEAAQLFVALAEMYGGEHGLGFCLSALDAQPGNDRAVQLADYFAEQLGRTDELPARWRAYLAANPGGAMSGEVRAKLSAAGPVAPPPPPGLPGPPASGERRAQATSTPPPRPKEESRSALDDLHAADQASPEKVRAVLAQASEAASKGNKAGAFAKYKEALALDPANGEALAWVKDHLRQKRLYGELRDALVAASRGNMGGDERRQVLRELAGLCEQQLRDVEGAIQALKQLVSIDRSDVAASESLRRLLEKASRWDELASVLEEEAMGTSDVEQKIALEKKLAALHETKRKDLVGAGEAWARIATLSPDDQAAWSAVKLFEKADRFDLAAQAIGDAVSTIDDKAQKSALLVRLAELRDKAGDGGAAGEAYMEAAQLTESDKAWKLAEDAFVGAGRFGDAAQSADARAELAAGDAKQQASLFAAAADLFDKAGDGASAFARLEQACELDPASDDVFSKLEARLVADERWDDLAIALLKRSDAVSDQAARKQARVRAASIQREKLDNMEAARESLMKVLEDGDDYDALALLADDAEAREDFNEAAALLRRLGAAATDLPKRVEVRMREARLLADNIDDVDGAVARYQSILSDLDPKHVDALLAIAELEERRDEPRAAAAAIERLVPLQEGEAKVETARRLAALYEGPLDEPEGAIRALEVVIAGDEEDFEAIAKLAGLCESTEKWPRASELLKKQIEVEGDEDEVATLSLKLSTILHEKLGVGDEALAALEGPADDGSTECRDAYVSLGDKLGWQGIVATKLVTWYESASASAQRSQALRGAFDRFAAMNRDAEATRVALELARGKGGDAELAKQLEEIGVRSKNLDALHTAHDLLGREVSGPARAEEMVRQAEVMLAAGVPAEEALTHGEAGLTSVAPGDAEPLLARLASIAPDTAAAIDLYERQVGRSKLPADRARALARAAHVAAEKGELARAKSFFELALAGGANDELVTMLEEAAQVADGPSGKEVQRTLALALAGGGGGSRDGGRSRSALLRRAAKLAEGALGDLELAFKWLGDGLVAYVDPASLDALEALGRKAGDLAKVEATLTRALSEVFDGPLVKQLHARRAQLRKDDLGDSAGAAEDLKKLHDLAPADVAVMEQLTLLLTELGDYRGMVQVLEDQILRGKDPAARAEIARKVAVLWEERLGDAREAADAWRRVLRMKQGDPEAQAGLERAKGNMLKKPDEGGAPAAPMPTLGLKPGGSATSTPAPAKASAAPAAKPSTPMPTLGARPTASPVARSAPPAAPPSSRPVPPSPSAEPEGRAAEPTTAPPPAPERTAPPPVGFSPILDEPTAMLRTDAATLIALERRYAETGEHAAQTDAEEDMLKTQAMPAAAFDDEPTRIGTVMTSGSDDAPGGDEEIAEVGDDELLDEMLDEETTAAKDGDPFPPKR